MFSFGECFVECDLEVELEWDVVQSSAGQSLFGRHSTRRIGGARAAIGMAKPPNPRGHEQGGPPPSSPQGRLARERGTVAQQCKSSIKVPKWTAL